MSRRPPLWGRNSCLRPVFVGQTLLVGQASRPAAGIPVGLGSLYPPTSPQTNRVRRTGVSAPSGASRQACHAGGRAGRATQTQPVRGLPTPSAAKTGGVARKTARSTWRRRCPWSKPPGLPCRRSRRQSNTDPTCPGLANAIRRQDWRRGPQDCALHLETPLPVEQAARLAMPAVLPVVGFRPSSPFMWIGLSMWGRPPLPFALFHPMSRRAGQPLSKFLFPAPQRLAC